VLELDEDQIIRADLFSGPARVKKFEERSGYYRLEVTLEESGEFRSLSLTPEQLDQVERVEANPIALSSDPEEFFLLVEGAGRRRQEGQPLGLPRGEVSEQDPRRSPRGDRPAPRGGGLQPERRVLAALPGRRRVPTGEEQGEAAFGGPVDEQGQIPRSRGRE